MRHGILSLAIVLGAGAALAQAPAPTRISSDPAPTTTGAASTPAPPPRPMGGYSYGKAQPQQAAPAPRVFTKGAPRPAGPVATLPGFEMLGDGGSRVFVQLTQTVPVEERKAKGSLTYVLKGAHVTIHNNTNPLVTVHFNTPVTEAKLRNAGGDLLLTIDLRVAATPSWKVTSGKDSSAILQIDFPKGSFITAPGSSAKPEK